MQNNNDRGFFGVIIPAEILSNSDLSLAEKFIYGYVASFRRCCFMSNEAIAEKLGMSESLVKHAIPKLEKLGYFFVEKENNNNCKRKIYSVLDNPKKLAYLSSKGLWKNLCKTQNVVQNMHDVVQNMHNTKTEVRSAKFAHIDKEENIEESKPEQKPNLENASDFGSLEAKSSAKPRPLRKDFSSDEEWEKAFYKWNYA